jgi:hypothetical protein
MKSFLLPCPCSATIVVGQGQAGGRAACSACGREIDVPRLGELGRLKPVAAASTAPPRTWTPAHACLVGGLAVAVIAWPAAVYVGKAPEPAVDFATVRAAVLASPIREIYKEWQFLSRAGVARPPMVEEQRVLLIARSAGGLANALKIVAGIGAAVGLCGAVGLAANRRRAVR